MNRNGCTVLTQETLKGLFDYEPLTGVLTFRPRARELFATDRAFAIFKSKCEGKPAGWSHSAGYVSVRVGGKDYLAHRLAVLWMTGVMPPDEVDHINGDRSDNRWGNLRIASKRENAHNQSLRVTNKTGVNGVLHGRRGNFRAEVIVDGRSIYLGEFKTLAEAAAARKAADRVLGYSRGHGKARVGDYYKPRSRASLPRMQSAVNEPDDGA